MKHKIRELRHTDSLKQLAYTFTYIKKKLHKCYLNGLAVNADARKHTCSTIGYPFHKLN